MSGDALLSRQLHKGHDSPPPSALLSLMGPLPSSPAVASHLPTTTSPHRHGLSSRHRSARTCHDCHTSRKEVPSPAPRLAHPRQSRRVGLTCARRGDPPPPPPSGTAPHPARSDPAPPRRSRARPPLDGPRAPGPGLTLGQDPPHPQPQLAQLHRLPHEVRLVAAGSAAQRARACQEVQRRLQQRHGRGPAAGAGAGSSGSSRVRVRSATAGPELHHLPPRRRDVAAGARRSRENAAPQFRRAGRVRVRGLPVADCACAPPPAS